MKLIDFLFALKPLFATVVAVILIAITIKIHGIGFFDKKRKYHPVAGTVIHQLFNFTRLLDYMVDRTNQRKTYRLLSFIRSEIYTANPVNIEYILSTNFSNYGKGWYHHSVLSDFLGDSIFTVDGEQWRHQRKATSYQFSTKMLRDYSNSAFKSNALKLAEIVSEAAISNNIIEMQELFMKATLDSVCKVILGVDLDTVCGTYKEGTEFSNAFDQASAAIMYRYFNFLWRIMRFLNIGSEAVLRKSLRVMDEFVYKLIRNKIEQAQKLHDNLHGKIQQQLLFPGFFMNFASTLMCRRRLHKKLEATNVAAGSTINELAARVTEENLEKMQYLHASLNETLRLHPAVPVQGKFCFSDDTWPDGFSVRKGDLVAFLPYVMGRMKFLWGEDAEKFRPERWLDENEILKRESPFKFTGFHAGPRICMGKEFAYRQMKIYSTLLLGSHSFKLADQNKSAKYKTMLTLQIDGGLHVYAFQREK